MEWEDPSADYVADSEPVQQDTSFWRRAAPAEPAPEPEYEEEQDSDLLDPDPKPVRGRTVPASSSKVPKAQQREIQDSLVMMISLPAATVMFKDPICASAVLDNAENIAAKLVPIICRNPAMLRWFTGGSGYMDYLALAMALAPVAQTVWGHHVTKSIGHERTHEQSDFSEYRAPDLQGGF